MLKLAQIVLFATLALTTAVTQAQGKTAVLNVQQAILMTDEAQNRLNDLRNRSSYKDNKAKYDEYVAEFNSLVSKIQKDAAVMGDAERQEQQRAIREKQADIEHEGNKLEAAQQEVAQAVMREQLPKLEQIIPELVKSEGIGLLLNSQAVLHYNNSYDITAKVTDRLNRAR